MIDIIYTNKHKKHNPAYEIYDGVRESYAEKPERLGSIVRALKENNLGNCHTPTIFPMKHIYLLHAKEYVDFLQKKSEILKGENILYPSYYLIDTYTPITEGTFAAAKEAVDCALTGATLIINGKKIVYSLCRPPGHHAEHIQMGGYCYFNNAAIAANYLSKLGTVAILDIDFHHGNGTQQLFYARNDVLYVSIHADPKVKFPYISGFREEIGIGKGKGYTFNYPLPLGTAEKKYLQALRNSLENIKNFHPNFLVVSAGFDTYIHDPIGGFKLTIPFYKVIGKEIASLKLPTLIIQEGGYAIKDLGNIAVNFVKGLQSYRV